MEHAFQFFHSAGGLQAGGQVLQVGLFARLADGLRQAVSALRCPPLPTGLRQVGAFELAGSVSFYLQDRRQRQFDPRFHALKLLEVVVVNAQCRLQFFEELLDLPTQRVHLHDLAQRRTRSFISRIFTSSGVGFASWIFVVENTMRTFPMEWTSRVSSWA